MAENAGEDALPAPAEEGGRYSDRFIPSRTGSNLAGFMHDFGEADGASHAEREARAAAGETHRRPERLLGRWALTSRRSAPHVASLSAIGAQDTSQAYTALLRSSLSPAAVPAALSPGRLGALERAGVLRRANTGGCVRPCRHWPASPAQR